MEAFQLGAFQATAFQYDADLPPIFDGPISSLTVVLNTGSYVISASDHFAGASSYSISPAVTEPGWSFNESNGDLSLDTNAVGTFGPYTITAHNDNGDTDSNEFTVTINAVGYLPPPGRTLRVALGRVN